MPLNNAVCAIAFPIHAMLCRCPAIQCSSLLCRRGSQDSCALTEPRNYHLCHAFALLCGAVYAVPCQAPRNHDFALLCDAVCAVPLLCSAILVYATPLQCFSTHRLSMPLLLSSVLYSSMQCLCFARRGGSRRCRSTPCPGLAAQINAPPCRSSARLILASPMRLTDLRCKSIATHSKEWLAKPCHSGSVLDFLPLVPPFT